VARAIKFTKEDALPLSSTSRSFNQQRLRATDQQSFQMGVAIAVVVLVVDFARRQPLQKSIQILRRAGASFSLNKHGGRRVRHENMTDAALKPEIA